VTLRLTAHAVGASDDPDLDVLVAGVAEHPDGSGWSLTFQGGSSDRTQADPMRSTASSPTMAPASTAGSAQWYWLAPNSAWR
jgi:hypothetical protein